MYVRKGVHVMHNCGYNIYLILKTVYTYMYDCMYSMIHTITYPVHTILHTYKC